MLELNVIPTHSTHHDYIADQWMALILEKPL